MKSTTPAWLAPVAAICTLQTTSAFQARFIPVIAPALSGEYGWAGSTIGYLSAANSVGGLAILVAGSAMLKRIGAMYTLQLTLLLGAACMMLLLVPSIALALAACFAMGLSNGVANPAGSEVLQKYSPPGKRNLLFSIKQAGVPLGGVMAGLLVPLAVMLAGWRVALVMCVFVVVLPTLFTWKLSARLDERPEKRPTGSPWPTLQSLRVLRAPLVALMHNRGLLNISAVGSLFAVSQSCWFTFAVIYLIDGLGFSLGTAGMVFAVMQTGGVIGRVVLGWLSDRLGSARATLSLAAVLSAATTVLLGLTNPGWPLWAVTLLAFVAGCSAASWNGVQMAEVARCAPPHLISETAAGSSIMIGLVNIVAPTAFASFVVATGHYDYAFMCAGACSLLVLLFLPSKPKAA